MVSLTSKISHKRRAHMSFENPSIIPLFMLCSDLRRFQEWEPDVEASMYHLAVSLGPGNIAMSLDQMIYPQGMVHRLPPMKYIHVLDTNTQAIKLETGPKTYVCPSGQKVVFGPNDFVTVPPQQYVTVENPVVRDKTGQVILDSNGQAVLKHGDQEVRTERDPFPLFPGEKLAHAVRALPTIPINGAVLLEATRDVVANDGKILHKAGQEWIEIGPKVMIPHPGTRIVNQITNYVIGPNEALHIKAAKDLVDVQGKRRIAGEEYLVRLVGSYLPLLNEIVIGKVSARVLTPKIALLVEAKTSFKDQFGNDRKVGHQYLITNRQTEAFIPCVEESIIASVSVTTLTSRQYCVVDNPIDPQTGINQYGTQELRKGPATFFLQPGEFLSTHPTEAEVLEEGRAMEIMAIQEFEDKSTGVAVRRLPGQVWTIYGPKEYWPPLGAKTLRYIRPVLKIPSLRLYIYDIVPAIAFTSFLVLVFLLLVIILAH